MPVSIAMKRLLRIRELQKEYSRSALESALSELEKLHAALAAARNRSAMSRGLVGRSIQSGELTDRIAGLEEERIADRCETIVSKRVAVAEHRTVELREDYLATRLRHRQAETLAQNILDTDARDEAKKSQSNLDEWYRSRR